MLLRIKEYKEGKFSYEKLLESFQGWSAYAKWANSYKLRRKVMKNFVFLQSIDVRSRKETINYQNERILNKGFLDVL